MYFIVAPIRAAALPPDTPVLVDQVGEWPLGVEPEPIPLTIDFPDASERELLLALQTQLEQEFAAMARSMGDALIPTDAPLSASEFCASLERKIAEAQSLGLGPPLVPPEGVRPVLLDTSDPSMVNIIFMKEDNN